MKNITSKFFGISTVIFLTSTSALLAADTNAPAVSAKEPALIAVKDLLKNVSGLDGKDVVLQGFVTDYCKRKGCWATLHDNDSEAKGIIKVQQDEEGPTFKPFLPELQGKTILVTGKVHATRIDTNYLAKWEARVTAPKAEGTPAAEKTPEQVKAQAAVLKQIASLRERVATSKDGYLTSVSLAVNTWQPKPE